MIPRRGSGKLAAGHGQRLWPAFALLTAVVALPTGGIFWFMNQAMQNEQFAIRQRLGELYRVQLQNTAERIQGAFSRKIEHLADTVRRYPAPDAFAILVKSGEVDSVLLFGNGRLVYPESSTFQKLSSEPQTPQWLEARWLEFGRKDFGHAAHIYAAIVLQSSQARERASAMVAEARCLNKAGKPSQAIAVLTRSLGGDGYRDIKDAQGRSVSLNAQLFALELMKQSLHPLFRQTATSLATRLNDYSGISIPSSQRRFLMGQVRQICSECAEFPTLAAEELAENLANKPLQLDSPGKIQPAGVPGVWSYGSPDRSFVAFFSQARLLSFIESLIAAQEPANGIRLSAIPPGGEEDGFLISKIGDGIPSWKLALHLDGKDPFQSAAQQKTALYVWTGILMTAGVVLLSAALAAYLGRQVRLTRLKNDLISTVSHELKTPLASMRLLVDTLRDGHSQDAELVRDYLQMISKENARLTSLIEGFLTYSRMERNRVKFEQEVLQPRDIIDSALEAVGSRLHAPGCRFEVELKQPLPAIIGDRDALVTVFVNLLDNALKYTGENKEIRLRGFPSNSHHLCFEIEDNGIGFPRSAAKRIFERFYQADRRLSRETGGCGLGLSIVQFIISAHKGSITAKSQPGKGSTFTILIPAAG